MTAVTTNGDSPRALWRHPDPTSTHMWTFLQRINQRHGLKLRSYQDLYDWSVSNISKFWQEVWEETGIVSSRPYLKVVDENAPMFPRPAFFPGAKLNFAENLLFPTAGVDPSDVAILTASEVGRQQITWAELRELVRQCQNGLVAVGVKEGDRVAGYVANHLYAVVAMLATTSLGAIWTAVSPDTGVHAVLERIRQIEPVVLFADNASYYNSKAHPCMDKVRAIVEAVPSLQTAVIISPVKSVPFDESVSSISQAKVYPFSSFPNLGSSTRELSFTQLDPDHPVYVLYSSGTTGSPKCIIHGAIGTLIQHKKEHYLHCSIGPGSRLCYFTTCSWMMWHWMVSGLASGATLVLYDGSPFRYLSPAAGEEAKQSQPDDLSMLRLVDELGITHFGTSAKYLTILEQKQLFPRDQLSLKTLQAIYSTGSPLPPSTFSYVYSAFPPTVNLGSITGGTDIVSLFGAPCPLTPVFEGEIQVRGLGMAVRARDPASNVDVTSTGEPGDLVCVRSFPCQPVRFWGPEGEAKYRSSYFDTAYEENDGTRPVWHHGDFVQVMPSGGLIMLGRSDGVLKPSGVRFGSAEIYNVLQSEFPDSVSDALCVGRRREDESDETVVLFVKMADGYPFDDALSTAIKKQIRAALSARHVPGVIDECPEIPVTTNGKKVETAVKQILCGFKIKISASVANAECLDWYRQWAATH